MAFEPFDRAAAERGIRLVTLSRAGFGDSSRLEGRSVASAAADAAALADHLGAERFVTIGWSGGGPHALACAALLPERVGAAATIAGVAPYDAEGLAWTDGMGEDNQIEYPLAARDPDELLRWMQPQVEALAVVEPDEIVSELRTPALGGRRGGGHRRARRAAGDVVPSSVRERRVGLVRRRSRVRPAVGVRARVDPGPGLGVAGTPGPDGAVRARRVAGGARPDGSGPPAPGARAPLARGGFDGRDPRRPARGRGRRTVRRLAFAPPTTTQEAR